MEMLRHNQSRSCGKPSHARPTENRLVSQADHRATTACLGEGSSACGVLSPVPWFAKNTKIPDNILDKAKKKASLDVLGCCIPRRF